MLRKLGALVAPLLLLFACQPPQTESIDNSDALDGALSGVNAAIYEADSDQANSAEDVGQLVENAFSETSAAVKRDSAKASASKANQSEQD